MAGLAILDWLVIGAYLAALLAIGIWTSRRVHSQEDYLLGGRRFGWLTQTFASFGQATSADGPVGTSSTTLVNGASGIWSSLLMLFATPLFWITSPWFRRLRLVTMGDFFEDRYGSKAMASAYAVIGTFGMMALLSLGFAAMTKTVAAIVPGLDPETLVWCVCLLVIAYTVAGGLEAAVYTDILQGVGILALSVLLLPSAWAKINDVHGGQGTYEALQTIHAELPEHFFDIFGSPAAVDFTWYYILALSAIATVTVVVQPNQMVTNSAAKTEMAARSGFVTGVLMKRCCTVLWGMVGLAAIVLYAKDIDDPDLTWGHAAADLLAPGLLGLMIASMMAALMSTADTLALTCTGLLLRNLYRPLAPARSEGHYILVGRVCGALVLIGAAFLATRFRSLLEIIKFITEFFIIFAPAFWLGLKWRRANRQGAWASILVTLAVFYAGPLVVPMVVPSLYEDPWLTAQTESREVSARYQAVAADVTQREAEIAAWRNLPEADRRGTTEPRALAIGDPVDVTRVLPPRSLFWSAGVSPDASGRLVGAGYLFPEMLALDYAGLDLRRYSKPTNDTVRVGIRLVVPFIVLVVVSLLTKRMDARHLDRFFTKMRTEVRTTGDDDRRRLDAANDDHSKVDRQLLFPGTDWEIYRWNRLDTVGFLAATALVAGVLVLLVLAVGLGA